MTREPPSVAPPLHEHGLDGLYERIATQGRTALTEGRTERDPLPVDGGSRWGVSAIFRLREWSTALRTCADELRDLIGSGHLVYAPDAFHITLRQFEGYRSRIDTDDPRLHRHAEALRFVAHALRPVEIRLRGLAGTPSSVIVKGWPADDLQRLRFALHDHLAEADGLLTGPEARRDQVRTSAHATLAIYEAPIPRPVELVSFLDRHRATDFGVCRFDCLWLAGYRRSRDEVKLIEYGRVDLSEHRS